MHNISENSFILRALFFMLSLMLLNLSIIDLCDAKIKRQKKAQTNYVVSFETDLPKKIIDILKKQSELQQKMAKSPASLLALTRRIKKDVALFQKIVKSYGYIDVNVTYDVLEEKQPIVVRIKIKAGQKYKLNNFQIFFESGFYDVPYKMHQLKKDDYFESIKIKNAEEKIVLFALNHGYPFVEFKKHVLRFDKENNKVDVDIYIQLNDKMRFGETIIEGNTKTKNIYILNRLGWKEGDVFSQKLIDDTRKNLIKSDIFDGVSIKPLKDKAFNGIVPIHIQIIENKRHYLGAGFDVSTAEGMGGKIFWGHRNLFNKGENFKIGYERQHFKRGFDTIYKIPDVFLQNQYLVQSIAISKQHTDAYQSTERHYDVGLEHHFNKFYKKNNGLGLSYEKVNDQKFRILSLPQSFSIDTTKNLLDPKKGYRLTVKLQPDFVLNNARSHFFTVDFEASKYFSLDKMSTHVLALRGKIGSIISTSFDTFPKTRLFYVGGAHSVRGYGYQMIGPLTDDVNPKNRMPIGGRSLFEGSIEWRYRLTESFGIVPFIDVGALSQNKFIKFKNLGSKTIYDSKLFSGAGFGGRYYLGDIGPIRVDIAMPLNRRKKIDRMFQFYASFGQSF